MDNQQSLNPTTESRAFREQHVPSKENRPAICYAADNRPGFAIQAQLAEAIQRAEAAGWIAPLRNAAYNRCPAARFTGHPAPVAQFADKRPPNPYNHLADSTHQTAHHILSYEVISNILKYTPTTLQSDQAETLQSALSQEAIMAKALRPFETLTLHQLIDATTGSEAIAEITLILPYTKDALTDDCVHKEGHHIPIIYYKNSDASETDFQQLTGDTTLYRLCPSPFEPPKPAGDIAENALPMISKIKIISPKDNFLQPTILAQPPSAENLEDFDRIYHDYQAIQASCQPNKDPTTQLHPLVQQLLKSLSAWHAGNLFIGPRSETRIEAGSKDEVDIDFMDLAINQNEQGTHPLLHQQLLLARSITERYKAANRLDQSEKDIQFLELKKQLKTYYTLLAQIPIREPVAENKSDYFYPTICADADPKQPLRFNISTHPSAPMSMNSSLLTRSQIKNILNLRIRLLKPEEIVEELQTKSAAKEKDVLTKIEKNYQLQIAELQKKYPKPDPAHPLDPDQQVKYDAELSAIETQHTNIISKIKQKQKEEVQQRLIPELLKKMKTGRHDDLMDVATLTSGKYLTQGALENIAIVHALKNAEEIQSLNTDNTANPEFIPTRQLAESIIVTKIGQIKQTDQSIHDAYAHFQAYCQKNLETLFELIAVVKETDHQQNPTPLKELTGQMDLLSNQMGIYASYLAQRQNQTDDLDYYLHTLSPTLENRVKPEREQFYKFIDAQLKLLHVALPGCDATYTAETWLYQAMEIKAGCHQTEACIRLLDFLSKKGETPTDPEVSSIKDEVNEVANSYVEQLELLGTLPPPPPPTVPVGDSPLPPDESGSKEKAISEKE